MRPQPTSPSSIPALRREDASMHPASIRYDMIVPEGGNLRYPVQPQYLLKARSIIDMVHSGTKLADALGFTEAPKAAPRRSSQNLVILYTDFEPDDVLAVAQILEWKAQLRELEQEPLIVFCADFKTKDGGTVFEKKQLMAALTLGITDYPILTYEGDRGLNRAFDGTIHPKAGQLAALRRSSIASICRRIADFKGERIDFYIMAPGHGNLGAIIGTLQSTGAWPLQAKWKVSMYTGSFNTRGMTDEDLKALEVIMAGSDHPLLDMSKFPFFGGKESHPVTASLGTFSCPSFGAELTAKAPLLAAAMVLFNEEFNQGLIHPENKSVFKGSDLDPDEETRFEAIKNVFYQRGVTAYAQALKHDVGLWKKVVDYKKTTVDAFATDACDSPLCDQLLFLYEWLATNKTHWLATSVNGKWCLNTRSGYTKIDPSGRDPHAFGSINAIQPILQNPKDEAMLKEIQEMLQHMVLQHLQQVQGFTVVETNE